MKSGGEGRDRKEKDEAGQWGGTCQGQGQEEAQGVEYDKKKEEGEEEIEEQQHEGREGGGAATLEGGGGDTTALEVGGGRDA